MRISLGLYLFVFALTGNSSRSLAESTFQTARIDLASSSTTPRTDYYIGESIVTADSEVTRHDYLIARTSDEAKGTISETAITYQRAGYKENSSLIKIDQNHFTMTESTGTVTGEGEFTGRPWQWTFLRAEFKAPNFGMRIVDYNFFADSKSIMGHKDFYIKDKDGLSETLLMQEDVVVHQVEKSVFDSKRRKLLKL